MLHSTQNSMHANALHYRIDVLFQMSKVNYIIIIFFQFWVFSFNIRSSWPMIKHKGLIA